LSNGAPEHANFGRILRGLLAPIWEWITRDLLPTMARDYESEMKKVDRRRQPTGNKAGCRHVPDQDRGNISRARSVRRMALGRPASNSQPIRPSHAAYGDLTRMLRVLRARDVLARISTTHCRPAIDKFDDARVLSSGASCLDACQKKQRRGACLRNSAGSYAAQASMAIDPPCHQARAKQERRGHRSYALCDRSHPWCWTSWDYERLALPCGPEKRAGHGRQGASDRDRRHRTRIAGPHRSARRNPSGGSACAI